jgi:hypothetical protein
MPMSIFIKICSNILPYKPTFAYIYPILVTIQQQMYHSVGCCASNNHAYVNTQMKNCDLQVNCGTILMC